MECTDCAMIKSCKADKTEVCNDFKANITEKKRDWKKILKYIGIGAGIGIINGVAAYGLYQKGKHKGHEEVYDSPEMKLIKDITAYDAMDDYQNNLFKLAETGDFASEFEFKDTGEKKYLIYTVSNEAPEWWNGENTQHFDLKEEMLKED